MSVEIGMYRTMDEREQLELRPPRDVADMMHRYMSESHASPVVVMNIDTSFQAGASDFEIDILDMLDAVENNPRHYGFFVRGPGDTMATPENCKDIYRADVEAWMRKVVKARTVLTVALNED